MKTLQDVLSLLEANRNSKNNGLVAHAKTLIGPRTHGSTTSMGLDMCDPETPIEKIDHPNVADACDCYKALLPQIGGKLGAIPLSAANLDAVRIRQGMHGLECYCELDDEERPTCDEIYFIVGEFAGETALFTWHPGEPLAVLSESTAVKC